MTIRPEVQAQIDGLMAENERLRAALESSRCPLPLSDADDDTVAACIRADACGCGAKEALSPARAALADTAENGDT